MNMATLAFNPDIKDDNYHRAVEQLRKKQAEHQWHIGTSCAIYQTRSRRHDR